MWTNMARYQQKALARKIFCDGFQGNGIVFELQLLVVYLRDVRKMGVKERKDFIMSFCEKRYPGFHPRADYKIIEDALKYAAKKDNHLVEVDSVTVYRNEIDGIEKLSEDENERKAMVTLLVRKKIDRAVYACRNPDSAYKSYMSYPANMKSFKRIKKEGHMKKDVDIFYGVMHGLDEKGLIEFMARGNLILRYMERLEETGGVAFEVVLNGFESAGLYYELFRGSKHIGVCAECGAAFFKNSNRQRFCKVCAPEYPHKNDGTHSVTCEKCGELFWESNKDRYNTSICKECRSER